MSRLTRRTIGGTSTAWFFIWEAYYGLLERGLALTEKDATRDLDADAP